MDKCINLFKTGALSTPWPARINGIRIEGIKIPEHQICATKCNEKECSKFTHATNGAICTEGLTYYQAKLQSYEIVVYGVIGENKFYTEKKGRQIKKNTKGRTVRVADFRDWLSKLRNLVKVVDTIEDEAIAHALHPLHDTMKWAEQIRGIAQKLLNKDSKKSFDENFREASREEKSLLKASEMLVGTFETLTLYANPTSAEFGQKRPVELYKLLHKLQMILDLVEAAKVNKTLKLVGQGYNKYYLYESFGILPLSIIQNAIKYSQTKEIEIRIEEDSTGALVSIKSIGPLIDDLEKKEIFSRGARGRWADILHHQGMGVGLYVAKIVASAHKIEIKVVSEPLGYEKNSMPQATNTFFFKVPLRDS